MKRIYFDSSAYTKVFTEETGSDNAKRLFELAYKNRVKIVLSVWTINESIAAIDKKCHQKKMMSQELCRKIIAATFRQIRVFWKDFKEYCICSIRKGYCWWLQCLDCYIAYFSRWRITCDNGMLLWLWLFYL